MSIDFDISAQAVRTEPVSTGRLLAFVGQWTQARGGAGSGGGISTFAVQEPAGALTLIASAGTGLNVGDLWVSPSARQLYAVDERKDLGGSFSGGGVANLAVATDGRLDLLGVVPTYGALPAYLRADPTGAVVVTANHGSTHEASIHVRRTDDGFEVVPDYDDGSVTLLPVRNGLVTSPADVVVLDLQSPGPDPRTQRSAHPHSANFDPSGSFVLVCDKGADTIHVFELDYAELRLKPASRTACRRGAGPRHSAFHPSLPVVYVLNELDSSLDVYRFSPDAGELSLLQTVPTVPDGTVVENYTSELCVHPSGGLVFACNRGHDSIASLAVDNRDGTLAPRGWCPCGGRVPRGMTIEPDGRFLIVANQGSDSLITFMIDEDAAALTAASTATASRPSCVRFARLPGAHGAA